MTYVEARPVQLRTQLEAAQFLAKSRIAFVVVPATSKEDFAELIITAAGRLGAIADEAEKEQSK